MHDDMTRLIFAAIDETISSEDFARLQDAIEQHDDVRQEYLRAIGISETLGEIAAESQDAIVPRSADHTVSPNARSGGHPPDRNWRSSVVQSVIAGTILLFVSGLSFWLGQRNEPLPSVPVVPGRSDAAVIESVIAGHATLRRMVDLEWPATAKSFREGDVLPNGRLQFDQGIAEIDFFSGATLIVEGPAILDIESDWSVRVVEGRLRANVPPAAQGFSVNAGDSEIVDLGTEFAVEVDAETARVEVIDGEVEIHGGRHAGNHLVTGDKQVLKGTAEAAGSFESLSTVRDVESRQQIAISGRFAEWTTHVQRLAGDDRLIAYYVVSTDFAGRTIRNSAATGRGLDGTLIGPVELTAGRFGTDSTGLEFNRPGARIRTRIDGEFRAFTFACWVRIDSLPHRYNALFLADSYETGEPHWQIRDDARLMFSVMVDDSQEIRHYSEDEQRMVTHPGLHRVYYTEPIWDVSKSGQWFHLAAVYDPVGRRVEQYVNGRQVSSETIIDRLHISSLRIGPAEIGNWGQPFRDSPRFAVRNLNGTIDELAIFDAALADDEINSLYEQGKPIGY